MNNKNEVGISEQNIAETEIKTIKAVVYARISSRKEEGTDTSIANQKNKCRQYIKLRDYQLVGIFQEEGVSAFTRNRPRFKELEAFLDEGKADLVVVYRLDRLTRNVGDLFLLLFDEKGVFKRNNVQLASVNELLDTHSAIGRLVVIIIGAINQFFRDLVADSMNELWVNWKAQGRMHTKAPIGYKITKGVLIPEEGVAEKVEEQFTKFANDEVNVTDIAKELNLSWSGVKNMLKNKTYLGQVVNNEKEWVSGQHQAIVGEDTFNRVQEKLNTNNNGSDENE